jgi:hypothetical protein
MRMSSPGSATMLESPAGVAQLAEQPSCKRQVSGSNPLTGSRLEEKVPSFCPERGGNDTGRCLGHTWGFLLIYLVRPPRHEIWGRASWGASA